MRDPSILAQVAYQAYGRTTGFKNFRGDAMPDWSDLGDRIQHAWIAAAEAVDAHDKAPLQGQLVVAPGEGGVPIIGRADPAISMSLGLIVSAAASGLLTMRNGQFVLTGADGSGAPVEVVYRPAVAAVADHLAANEGGWITCERVQ